MDALEALEPEDPVAMNPLFCDICDSLREGNDGAFAFKSNKNCLKDFTPETIPIGKAQLWRPKEKCKKINCSSVLHGKVQCEIDSKIKLVQSYKDCVSPVGSMISHNKRLKVKWEVTGRRKPVTRKRDIYEKG